MAFWLTCGGPWENECSDLPSCVKPCDSAKKSTRLTGTKQLEPKEIRFESGSFVWEDLGICAHKGKCDDSNLLPSRDTDFPPIHAMSSTTNETDEIDCCHIVEGLETTLQHPMLQGLQHEQEPQEKMRDVLKGVSKQTLQMPAVHDVSSKRSVQVPTSNEQQHLNQEALPNAEGNEQALKENDIEGDNHNIGARADLNKADENGATLAFVARADIDSARQTHVFMAAQDGHSDVVQLLINARAAMDTAREDGTTLACVASGNGHVDVVQLLIDARADMYKASRDRATPASMAAQSGHTTILQLLVGARADIDQRRLVDISGSSLKTGLHGQSVQTALSPHEEQQLKQESLPNAEENIQLAKEAEIETENKTQNSVDCSRSPFRSSLRERLSFWTNTDAQECGFFFFATGAFLEREWAPNGQKWADYVAPVEPAFINDNLIAYDNRKVLVGPWQECMHSAVVYENSNPGWEDDPEYRNARPSQQVVDFFEACGHGDQKATLEQAMHDKRKELQSSGASGMSISAVSSPIASVMSSRWSGRD